MMVKICFGLAVVIAASIGAIAGSDYARRQHAWGDVTTAHGELSRSEQLRADVDHLRARFVDVRRDLDAAQTPAAATAARAKLFQLRVDMVAIEDELAVLVGHRPVAREF
jgi:hypothetical protein